MKCFVLRNHFAILTFTNKSTSNNIIFLNTFFYEIQSGFEELTVIKK